MVEVCISSETQFEREVMVTAETGPTTGATNQATGIAIQYVYMYVWWFYIHFNVCFFAYNYIFVSRQVMKSACVHVSHVCEVARTEYTQHVYVLVGCCLATKVLISK